MKAYFIFIFSLLLFIGAAATTSNALAATAMPSIDLNWNHVLNNLSSPFQNFSQSLQSAANTPISTFTMNTSSISNISFPENVSTDAQNTWEQFDTWLFNVTGFHIAAVFNFIFGIIAWISRLIKIIIGWIFSLLHG